MSKKIHHELVNDDDRSWIKGKNILVTGCTNGIGRAFVEQLCTSKNKPQKILLCARNQHLASELAMRVESAEIACNVYLADFSKPKDILKATKSILFQESALHCIMSNAGTWITNEKREGQEDGLEIHYVVNYLSMVLLVTELLPLLEKSAPARVCVTGSFTSWEMMKGELDFEHLHTLDGPSKMNVPSGFTYAHSKLMQHVWCKHFSTLLDPSKVTINVCDPGAVNSNIPVFNWMKKKVRCLFCLVLKMNGTRTTEVGCQSLLHLCTNTSMSGVNGMYLDWGRKKPALIKRKPCPLEMYPEYGNKIAPSTSDPGQCKRLYDETEILCKQLRDTYSAREGGSPRS